MSKSGSSIHKQLEKTERLKGDTSIKGLSQKKLKGDVCTRWGSKIEMIKELQNSKMLYVWSWDKIGEYLTWFPLGKTLMSCSQFKRHSRTLTN